MNAEAMYKEAHKFFDEGDFASASTCFSKLIALHKDDRFHSAFAYCLQRLGHWDQSIIQFLAALELKPHYCESDTRLGLADSYLKLGKLPKAIEQWRIVSRMTPTYPSYDETINAAKSLLDRYA
jgi:tetratricopeptide (TPR) repeat protein